MIRTAATFLMLCIISSMANAQTVTVRSGEHEGFTRIVLQMPKDVDWSFDSSGRRAVLKVSRSDIRYDTSQVFDRISHERLENLKQADPGSDLVFDLGCQCEVVSFVQPPGFLVIDIKDAKEPETEPVPGRFAITMPVNQMPYRLPLVDNGNSALPTAAAPRLVLPPTTMRRPVVVKPPEITVSGGNQDERFENSINVSEERLLAQIERASEQGLLALKSRPNGSPSDQNQHPDGGVGESAELPLPVSLSATTVIDRDLAGIAHVLSGVEPSPVCIDSDRLALHKWGGKEPFDVEIGRWRSRLFEEFDRIDPNSALGLARAYLHFGFGAEAIRALSLVPRDEFDHPTLTALAQLLDHGRLSGSDPFAGQQGCDGDVSLWAVFAAPTWLEKVNSEAVKRAFGRLPLHLRVQIGPQLSRIFSRAGDSEMADSILRAVTRTGVESGSGIELAKADIAKLHGDAETADHELSKSIAAGSDHSPRALVELVEATFQQRIAIAPDLPELAAAYAVEYRYSDMGPVMRRTHAVALALDGRFPEAFGTLQDLTERDGQMARDETLVPLLALLSERADDVVFLQTTLPFSNAQQLSFPEDVEDAVARRLLELGFATHATRWLTAPGGKTGSVRRQVIRAEVALAQHLPHRAMVELLGQDGPEAARLRASAMLLNGDYHQAGQMFVAAEEIDAAIRGFWLAEEWEAAPNQTDAHYGQVLDATRQLDRENTNSADLPPLAQARALVQASLDIREDIADLLQMVEIGTVPE